MKKDIEFEIIEIYFRGKKISHLIHFTKNMQMKPVFIPS